MNLELIKRRLIEQEEVRKEITEKNLVHREKQEEVTKLMKTNLIKSIIGPRRAGKTTLGLISLKKDFYYINFDDEVLSTLRPTQLGYLLEYCNELFGKRKKIMLDEIQNIKRWELFVNRLQRLGYNVLITGSNSKLLSKELSTHLGGRSLPIELLPFSFREFLRARKIGVKQGDAGIGVLKRALEKYMLMGGFPEVIINDFKKELRNSYYREIFRTIVERDITQRHNLRYPNEIKTLALLLMNYFSSRISFRKLSKDLGISVHTIKNYLYYLEEAYLFITSKKYSTKPKESELSLRKIYCIDTGIINSFKASSSRDFGRLMENTVAIELKRRAFPLYYYLSDDNKEVDFVIKRNNRIKWVVQVVYDNNGIPERELKNGLKACKELKCKNLIIITWNKESSARKSGIKVVYKPLWKFLLDDDIKEM